jgi:hypothetical protein
MEALLILCEAMRLLCENADDDSGAIGPAI